MSLPRGFLFAYSLNEFFIYTYPRAGTQRCSFHGKFNETQAQSPPDVLPHAAAAANIVKMSIIPKPQISAGREFHPSIIINGKFSMKLNC